MLSFEWPWLFTLLPLPALIYWLAPRADQQQAAVRVPFFQEFAHSSAPQQPVAGRRTSRLLYLIIGWCLLVGAAASPVWIGDPVSLPSSGRDLMLAVDISGSMEREDMMLYDRPINRLVAVKNVLNDFIQRRQGDRLGLVLFADQAYLQSPLTQDLTTVRQYLDEAQLGFAGSRATAIGDAIGLTVKRLKQRPGERHVVVLLTDGANTGGQVEPLEAAELAAQHNITIYTVGIGAESMVTPGLFGTNFGARRINPSADLDEKTLQGIADKTGGRYFRARNPEQLSQIYALLDELEPVEDKAQTYRPTKSLFYWPLALVFALSLALALQAFLSRWHSKHSSPLAEGARH
jgi:Ca-activated chloride channel family protein